jgi:hypothetical protein
VSSDIRWTVEEAVAHLDPPMDAAEVRAMITACDLRPAGYRRTGARGRPAPEYPLPQILRAHAAIIAVRDAHRPPLD